MQRFGRPERILEVFSWAVRENTGLSLGGVVVENRSGVMGRTRTNIKTDSPMSKLMGGLELEAGASGQAFPGGAWERSAAVHTGGGSLRAGIPRRSLGTKCGGAHGRREPPGRHSQAEPGNEVRRCTREAGASGQAFPGRAWERGA